MSTIFAHVTWLRECFLCMGLALSLWWDTLEAGMILVRDDADPGVDKGYYPGRPDSRQGWVTLVEHYWGGYDPTPLVHTPPAEVLAPLRSPPLTGL